jgi:5'-3' exonuclease
MRTSAGLSTEAVYIFNNMLRKLAKSYAPEYIAAVFESGAPVARIAEFADYKANRAEMPPTASEPAGGEPHRSRPGPGIGAARPADFEHQEAPSTLDCRSRSASLL